MPAEPRKSYWRFDRDQTNRVSTERIGRGQPVADTESPVADAGTSGGEAPRGAAAVQRGVHAAQLRHAIDGGRSRAKVAHPYPAAAPLGTDDEAAGTTPGPDRVAIAMRYEGSAPGSQPTSIDPDRGRHVGLALTIVAAAALAAVMAAMLA